MRPVASPVTEDDLHAYVDGYLDADGVVRVEAYLRGNPEAARRIDGWTRGRDGLRGALQAIAAAPVPSSLDVHRLSRARIDRREWSSGRLAASLVAAVAIGCGAGWMARGAQYSKGLAGLSRQAALNERIFGVTGRLSAAEPARVEQLVGEGSAVGARTVRAPDLTRDGFELVGSRIVATEQGAAPMLFYRDGRGRHIGLFIRLMIGVDAEAPVRSIDFDGVTGFAWSHDGIGYGLVAPDADPPLRPLAEGIRNLLATRT